MNKTSTTLLGAGVLMGGLAVPLAASAHSSDQGLAFVAGAVVGHVLSEQSRHVHHVHRRPPAHVPAVHYRHLGWQKGHAWDRKHRHHDCRDHDRRHHRYDRRHDRRDHHRDGRGYRRG